MNSRRADVTNPPDQIDNLIADCDEDVPASPQLINANPDAPWHDEKKCYECQTYFRYYLLHVQAAPEDFGVPGRRERLVKGWACVARPNCETLNYLGSGTAERKFIERHLRDERIRLGVIDQYERTPQVIDVTDQQIHPGMVNNIGFVQ